MTMKILNDCRGYAVTFFTEFLGIILIPVMALSAELGHYFYVWVEIANPADAASLTAAAGIS
jgi:Flp pilus assembly protein TadG